MLSEISIKNIEIGSILYSDYTKKRYVVSCLPRLINGEDYFALVRLDGAGYCYLHKTLDEVRRDVYCSGEDHYLIKDGEWIMIEGC